jgi:hypothetical protein
VPVGMLSWMLAVATVLMISASPTAVAALLPLERVRQQL